MEEVITIGVDLAKNVFQVHGVDGDGKVVIRRQLRRARVLPFFAKLPPCLVGMEACATAHHWAREIGALGHEVRLMPPRYVKPYVKRNKTDAADAEAISEAVTRPTMRFVAIKDTEQQGVLMLHRSRELLVRQRTMLVNAIRAHMAEFGIVAPTGIQRVKELFAVIADEDDDRLPAQARTCLQGLVRQFLSLHDEISLLEKRIHAWHRSSETSRRLETIPGIGPITASALAASISDPHLFRNGRELAAWIGLVPRQSSTGGRERLGHISKQGDQYLRWLLVAGAMSVIRQARHKDPALIPWLAHMLATKPAKLVAVAQANKTARIAWALLRNGGTYQRPEVEAAA
jgi:transposase